MWSVSKSNGIFEDKKMKFDVSRFFRMPFAQSRRVVEAVGDVAELRICVHSGATNKAPP